MFADVLLVVHQFVAQELFEVRTHGQQTGNAVYGRSCKVKPVQFIEDGHIEGRRRRAFFAVTVHMEVCVIRSLVSETVNERRITVKSEDHGLVGRED